MPAETVETYQFQPAERSIFSAKPPSSNKPVKSSPIMFQPQKTITIQPLKVQSKK